MATGAIYGAASGLSYARQNDLNPWTGRHKNMMDIEALPFSQQPSSFSPKVEDIISHIKQLELEGATITPNELGSINKQEINYTIKKGDKKIDMRIETHKVPKKYGGNGKTPQRHFNADYKFRGRQRGQKIHIFLD